MKFFTVFSMRFTILFSALTIVVSGLVERASAQLSIISPSVSNVTISAAPDYAADVHNHPWDMNSSADLGNYEKTADTSGDITFSGGNLIAPTNSFFYMQSPLVYGSNPTGKSGPNFYIDTNKYHYLNVHMYVPAPSAMSFVVNLGYNFFENLWISNNVVLKPGWHTYSVDMRFIGRSSGRSDPWESKPVTGLRIQPAVSGPTAFIDWITLSGDASESTTINYTFTPGGAGRFHSLFLDNDTDLSNGFEQNLQTMKTSVQATSVNGNALFPGRNYYILGITSSDFASLYAAPWSMKKSDDISLIQHASVQQITSDDLKFTIQSSGSSFDLNTHGETIPADTFKFLRLNMNVNITAGLQMIFQDSTDSYRLGPNIPMSPGVTVYDFNMTGVVNWTGNIKRIYFAPVASSGELILHEASLRSDTPGAISSTTSVSPGVLHINQAPLIKVLQPDEAGGADYAATELGNPWNMDDAADIIKSSGVISARLLPNNSVGGIQGNFYNATSLAGLRDPVQESVNTFDRNMPQIDTHRYKNIVYRLLTDASQSYKLGSIVRIVWRVATEGLADFYNGDDAITFDGWYTYVQDMRKIQLDEDGHAPGTYPTFPWYNTISHLRVDAHEFEPATAFFFDFIRVTADDESNTRFLLTADVSDPDSNPASTFVSFYYITAPNPTGGFEGNNLPVPTGGTLIGSFNLSQPRHFSWDTQNVPNGTYYIYAVATDGKNETRKMSTGRLVVDHGRAQDSTVPILQLDNPQANSTLYDTVIMSGYALDNIQLATVDVLVDGAFKGQFQSGIFDKRAQDTYRSFAESGNAGFRSQLDLSSVSAGTHTMEVRAYDTAGNVTSTGSFNFVKSGGGDPSPFPEPVPVDEGAIELPVQPTANPNPTPTLAPIATATPRAPVPTSPPQNSNHPLSLSVKTTNAKAQLDLTINGGASCLTVELIGQIDTGKKVSTISLKKVPGASQIKIQALKVKKYKPKNKKEKLALRTRCNSEAISAASAISPKSLKSAAVSSGSSWFGDFKKKMKVLQ